jgi:hypothetical protein
MARIVMLAPPPRDVPLSLRAKLMFGGSSVLFGWFFFGFSMIFALEFVPQNLAAMYWSLQPHQTASGIASGSRKAATENDTTVYENRFSFTAADGQIYHGRSYATGTALQAGEPVTVEYPASSPAHAKIRGMRRSVFGHVVLVVVLFPGIGLNYVLGGLVSGSRACHLLAHGKLAMGAMKSKERTNTQINKQYVYRLKFEFTAEDGQVHEASADTVHTAALEDEAQEALFYDPQQPTRAIMADNLPGSPEFDATGNIQPKPLRSRLGAMVVPTLVMIGIGYYVWRQF